MKGRSWWIDDLNVVGICVRLLYILADWLTDARCPHYFVNNCNLFDSLDNSQLTQNPAEGLRAVTESWLAQWFVHNYIRKCGNHCRDSRVSRLFDDISTHIKLQKAASVVANWRLKVMPVITYIQFSVVQHIIHSHHLALLVYECV